MKKKGIYCLEGLWNHHNVQDKSTVLPILDLMNNRGYCDYVYHDCATREELEFFLDKWKQRSVGQKFPILYLAFHGEQGCIFLTNKQKYTLEDLGKFLHQSCQGKVVYFGSCSTFDIDMRIIKRFLENTGAIAAIGYRTDVDWIQSAACDLFVFEALQGDKLDSRGIEKIHQSIITNYGNLHKLLDLRVVINDRLHFPRSRKPRT
jgi:hypothetical protein